MQFFLRLGWVTPRKQAAFLPTSFILNHPLLLAWWLSRSQKNPETPGDHMQNNYWLLPNSQVPLANLIITVQRAVLAHFEVSLPVSLIGTPNNVSLMFSYNFSSCLCAWSEIWWETSENTLQQNLLYFCSLVSRTIFSLCSVIFENNDNKSEAGALLPNCVLTFLWEVSTSEISKIYLQSQNDSFGTLSLQSSSVIALHLSRASLHLVRGGTWISFTGICPVTVTQTDESFDACNSTELQLTDGKVKHCM